MLAATTSGRGKELVNQELGDRNGMIAFEKIRERVGKTRWSSEALRRVSVPVDIL